MQTDKIPQTSIQERMIAKALDAFDEVEVQIDAYIDSKKSEFDMYAYLKSLGYSAKVIKHMRGQLDDVIFEVENKEGCEQLEESYDFFTAAEKKKFLKWCYSINASIDKYCKEYTPVPKPPKAKTPAQLVRKLPYMREYEGYTSINPEDIIRARALYTYNTSSKKFTAFHSEGGLRVLGSKIIDFDVCSEKTLTDHHLLGKLVQGGNIIAKGFIDKIPRSKLKVGNNLITKNTLLLKVTK
jgi:hypothetical protein